MTEKDFGRTIAVKNGDVILVSLPGSVPMLWVPKAGPSTTLQAVERAPKTAAEDAQKPKDQPPTYGGTGRWEGCYRVNSDRRATLEPSWIYARFGKVERTYKRIKDGVIPPAPAFRPDQKPSDLREGMDFHVKLDVRP